MQNPKVPPLNLPEYPLRRREKDDQHQAFDPIRKKWVALTPEEWVRQHFIQYLIHDLNYPAALIAVEMGIKLNRLRRRCDIVVYNRQTIPWLIVECKAPEVPVNQKVIDQVVRYNMELKVKYLIVTNGVNHFGCAVDYEKQTYRYLNSLPDYEQMS